VESHNEAPLLTPDNYPLWYRPLRILFGHDGKPPGQTTVLNVETPCGRGPYPFGALSYTPGRRLLFHPLLPESPQMEFADGTPAQIDHVTLEPERKRIHVTGFDASGKRVHPPRRWKLYRFPGKGLAFWFVLLTRWSLIEQQGDVRVMERRIWMPTKDAERRTTEFENYLKRLDIQCLQLPPCEALNTFGDYFYCLFYWVNNPTLDILAPLFFPPESDREVEGWPDGPFAIQPIELSVGSELLVIATASPPGRMRKDVVVGCVAGP